MNGAKKFHSPDGPAFAKGEMWHSSCGHVAKIESIERYGANKWDVNVHYTFPESSQIFCKDAWDFQVRYQPD